MLIADIATDSSFTSFAPMFLKTVLVTIGIIILAIVAIRFLIPRLHGLRRNKDSKIQILDFQPLDPRKSVYILQIENKRVAVGVTEQTVSKICDLN